MRDATPSLEPRRHTTPFTREEMLAAMYARDGAYDGRFYIAVTTTGVFCRLSCPAPQPKPENVRFYASAAEALVAGFRPCKRCRPLESAEGAPAWAAQLVARVEADPEARISDADLRADGLDPAAVRRWFQTAHGLSFHAYCRARRLRDTFAAVREGRRVSTPPGSAAPIRLAWLETSIGPLLAGATGDAVCLLEFPDRRMIEAQLETLRRRFRRPLAPGGSPLLDRLRDQLDEYLAGRRTEFDLPLDHPGSPFQRRVWDALRRIPYGETRTYAQLAAAIGAPGAARAVGNANGANRIAVIIPCHRVVAADGGLGGYGGGLWRKRRLLEIEGARMPDHAAEADA